MNVLERGWQGSATSIRVKHDPPTFPLRLVEGAAAPCDRQDQEDQSGDHQPRQPAGQSRGVEPAVCTIQCKSSGGSTSSSLASRLVTSVIIYAGLSD